MSEAGWVLLAMAMTVMGVGVGMLLGSGYFGLRSPLELPKTAPPTVWKTKTKTTTYAQSPLKCAVCEQEIRNGESHWVEPARVIHEKCTKESSG